MLLGVSSGTGILHGEFPTWDRIDGEDLIEPATIRYDAQVLGPGYRALTVLVAKAEDYTIALQHFRNRLVCETFFNCS